MADKLSAAAGRDTGRGTEFLGGYGRTVSSGINVIDKPLEFKKTFFKLVRDLSLYKYLISVAAVFAVISTVFVIFGPRLMSEITDMIFDGVTDLLFKGGGLGERSVKDGIYGKLALLFLLYLFSSVFLYAQGFIMASVSQKVSLKMRSEINKKISRLPVGYFDKHSHGDVLSRITNDVDTVGNTLNQGLSQIITAVCTIVGITIMMIDINVLLAAVVLIILPLSYAVIRLIAKRSQEQFRRQQNYLGAVNGYIEEMYGGHSVVKAFGMEKKSGERFESLNEKLYETAWRSQMVSGFINPLVLFISNLGYVAVMVFGAYLTAIGRNVMIGGLLVSAALTPGMLYAFIQYVRSFTSPINQTAQISNIIQSTVAAAERIYVFLDESQEVAPVKPAQMPAPEDIKGGIVFENLTFGYEKDVPVLKNFSFEIKAGSRVAIVGRTGSGKTTVVKLLMRFYDADGGRILLDGADISAYDKSLYRKNIAMVLQDTWLFNGTIADNIRYGRLDADDAEVRRAAEIAGAHEFISALKDGYNTVINEEAANVSEGQKQLLSIARAVIRRSRIMIFDEATSSIDTMTEKIIQEAVEKITKGKTCIVIAHRLSTIINSDVILVMEDGELRESGSHEELLKKDGLYAEMYKTQYRSGRSGGGR
ncbi:MAG: ABC transporter ATP-binding protein/permease [Clostridiales bacterium]|jgi:ATP-binding cassette subfamily B protein|nr:ABC transporter ATP-binding protein/permease [Clostridiales bacterium]